MSFSSVRIAFFPLVVVLLSACGGPGETAVPGAGGSSGSGGAASGGVSSGGTRGSSGGGSSAGGSSAGGGSGTAGSGGSGTTVGPCGTFGEPQMVFASPDILSSVSITGDELELFYIVGTQVFVSKRASVADPFADAIEVTELSPVCAGYIGPALDVTVDGLRIYLDCEDGPTPLFLAQRASRGAAFEVLDTSFGMTDTSIGISADELAIYTTTTDVENWQPLLHVRATTAEPFGGPMPIPGISSGFRMAEPSSDGLTLFGVVPVAGTTTQWRLAKATRTTQAGSFTAPTTDGLPDPSIFGTMVSDYTPTLNASCTALYFLRLTSAEGVYNSTLEVLRRQ